MSWNLHQHLGLYIRFFFGNYDAICRYAVNVVLSDQVGMNDFESVKDVLSWEMI